MSLTGQAQPNDGLFRPSAEKRSDLSMDYGQNNIAAVVSGAVPHLASSGLGGGEWVGMLFRVVVRATRRAL